MAEDYFDYVLDGTPAVEPTDWEQVAAVLEQSQAARIERLEQELAQIEAQLRDRDRLHEDLVGDLDRKINRYTDRLEHLYTISKGRLDGTREQLKDRITVFYQELRDEHRAHWRDRQELEQERRHVQRELAEVSDESLSELF
jgi:acetyl-CoA carboxylase carboxyltransferase component